MQIFLINWIADCYLGHAWIADRILSVCKYSLSIGLHMIYLDTRGEHCMFYFVMENSCVRQLEF